MPLPTKKAKMRWSFFLKEIQETVSPQNMSKTRSEIRNQQLMPAVSNVHVSYLWFPDALRMYMCFGSICIVACDQFNVGKLITMLSIGIILRHRDQFLDHRFHPG